MNYGIEQQVRSFTLFSVASPRSRFHHNAGAKTTRVIPSGRAGQARYQSAGLRTFPDLLSELGEAPYHTLNQ